MAASLRSTGASLLINGDYRACELRLSNWQGACCCPAAPIRCRGGSREREPACKASHESVSPLRCSSGPQCRIAPANYTVAGGGSPAAGAAQDPTGTALADLDEFS